MLEPGAKLPSFKLPDQTGQTRTLAQLRGPRGLVIFVYARDNTSGCTAEAAEFQERLAEFAKLGFAVAGLSKDSYASHAKFAAKLELSYPLLSDPELGLIQGMGAWGMKKLYGKTSQGVIRGSLVVDAKGKVLRAYAKVKAKGHAQGILEDLAA